MTCEECQGWMPEFWDGALEEERRSLVEMHLASCLACRAEAQRLNRIWAALARVPEYEPSPALRARFYERLEAYGQGYAEAAAPVRWNPIPAFRSWWSARPMLGLAAGLAMLVAGFLAGFLSRYAAQDRQDNSQIGQLRGEVSKMKQLVALSLLQQQNASDRLRGVSWAYRVEQPDTETLSALLYTVNHDTSVNVRLAAVDAIRTFADSPVARKGLVQAISKQNSPLVQIALIDELADVKDSGAVTALQALVKDRDANPQVRGRAQWALGKIQ